MKKHYTPTTVEVIKLSSADVLTASSLQPDNPPITTVPPVPSIPVAPDDPDLLEPML
ncbi:MAG: hypothetical protein IJW16_02975 [Clostridia bacterium]|nr:hypothetical protein [Clostridia bacterium]